VAFLAPKTFDFSHRNAIDADFRQRFPHVVELEWLDDGGDHFHLSSAPGDCAWVLPSIVQRSGSVVIAV